MNTKNILIVAGACLFLLSSSEAVFCQEKKQELIEKEVVIETEPNIIVLPEGEAAVIPISAVRIRSTELRDLNKKYNVAAIEKLYQLKEEGSEPSKGKDKEKDLKLKGLKGELVTEKKVARTPVDIATIFTRDLKKGFKDEGKEVREAKTLFLFRFHLAVDQKIEDILLEYKKVTSVINAEVVIRKAKDEKTQSENAKK